MLSIKAIKNSSSATDYYKAADYYVKGDPIESVSYWQGKGAKELGLKGVVDSEKLKELLDGKVDGQQLGLMKDGELKHKCGWDLTFSAPKSVSIMALVGNDKRLLRSVKEANDETIAYIESKYAITRQMKGGKLAKTNEKNIVCASFVHTTSRELDPQAHVHNVIQNMVKREDGQWRSIESRDIYDNSKLFGLMFRSRLAPKVQDLGYEIEVDTKKGFFEIKGVDRTVIDSYSKRREQIEKMAKDTQVSDAKAMDRLNLLTRKSKREVTKDELLNIWDSEKKELGFNPETLVEAAKARMHSSVKDIANVKVDDIVQLSAKSLFEMEAVVSRNDLLNKALTISIGKYQPVDIDKAIDKAVSEKKIFVSNIPLNNDKEALTTEESYRVENYILKLAHHGQGTKGVIISSRKLDCVLKESSLNKGQESAVRHIVTTRDQVIAVQGYAGTGKTTMLRSAAKIIKDQEYSIVPLAAYNSSAKNLEDELNQGEEKQKVKASTVSSYIYSMENQLKENPNHKAEKDILILDEAGQVNAKDMASILTIVRKTGSRLVLVGDKAQIGAVEWGKPFNLMLKNGIKYTEMTEIRRQNDEKLKQAVVSAINHDYKQSIELLKENAVVDSNEEHLKDKLVDDYFKLSKEQRKETLVVIPDNKTRYEVMQSVRERLVSDGIVKGDQLSTTIYTKSGMNRAEKGSAYFYQSGQIIEFNKNYKSLDINKNEKLKVLDVDKENGIVKLSRLKNDNVTNDDAKKIVEWKPAEIAGRAKNGVDVYELRQIQLGEGDKIIWNKTDKDNNLRNGEEAHIIKVFGNTIDLKFQDKIKTIDTTQLKNFDYAYAMTAHLAQGKTYARAFGMQQSYRKNLVNQKTFYVVASRAKDEFRLYTDNIDNLTRALYDRDGEKTSSIESLQSGVKETYSIALSKVCSNILNKGINIFSSRSSKLKFVSANKIQKKEEPGKSIDSLNDNYNKKEVIDAKEVDLLLKSKAGEVAQHVLGKYNKKVGRNMFFGSNKGSLAVTISGDYAGTWTDFDSGDKGNLITLIQKQYGLSFRDALEEAAKLVNYIPGDFKQRLNEVVKAKAESTKITDEQKLKIKYATKLANEGQEIKGTPAEKYLKETRGIDLKDWPKDLKYHEGVYSKLNGGKNPALIAIARDKDNNIQSVQAIFLNNDTGEKADVECKKQTFGSIKGAVFLASTENYSTKSAIVCEGPEDALSILKSTSGSKIYACLGKSNLNNLDQTIVNKFEKITLALDNDGKKPSEMPEILNVASRLSDAGKEVLLSQPNIVKQDYNDLLKTKGTKEVSEVLAKSIVFDNNNSVKEHKTDKQNEKNMEKEI